MSGDLVTDFDIKEIIGYHQVKNAKVTITLTSVEDPLQFGVVITDKDGTIIRFLEKPGWGEVFSDTINTGIYVFEPEILKYIPENVPYDFSKDLFPKLMEEGIPLYGFNAKGYWRDVGNPESYRDVHKDIFNGKVKIQIEGEKINFDKGVVYKEEGVEIPENVKISGMVVLDKDVKISPNTKLENVSIGKNTQIGKNTTLKDGVIWWDVNIGNKCKFNNFVICNDVNIGNNVKAEKGVIIAEDVDVQNEVVFEKDVIVWPNKLIESGSIVSSNLIWGDKWKKSIFEGGKVSGRTNIELSCEMAAKLAEAFGSILPKGQTVYMSRDYHRASRMLKRAFLGGLLSTGINVVDLKLMPLPVMRFHLAKSEKAAGIHFRQSPNNPSYTEILFYDSNGIPIDTGTEKSVERIFFREQFRRANFNEIGEIEDNVPTIEQYESRFLELIDIDSIQSAKFKIVADLLNGSTSIVYPEIINKLNVETIILDAYFDEKKLSLIPTLKEKAIKEISKIVKVLDKDIGFLLYPNGQRLRIICETEEVISNDKAVLMFLYLIDKTIDKQVKVYLPVSVPDVMDDLLENIIVERGKMTGLKASFLQDYYFVANLDGNYMFPEFSFSPDGMFASVKLLEMLAKTKLTPGQVLKSFPDYYFKHVLIGCPSSLKGKMMRKFTEEAMNKEASFIDGVKIYEDKKNWVLMIPDQYSDNLHLYVQAENKEKGEKLLETYREKINKWIEEA